MAAKRDRDGWLEDFSLTLSSRAMRSRRRDPQYEVFAGAKPPAILWLIMVCVIAGAFGGMLVSGALWRSLLLVPAWLAAIVTFSFVAYRSTRLLWGSFLAFLAGWCIFWGVLIGLCAMWAAQLSSSGWAYGIALGIGFLIGITQGSYEPDDLQGRDSYFALGTVSAPAAACFAAWFYRNPLGDPGTLGGAALTGAVAGLLCLGPLMTMLLVRLNNVDGLRRLASLLLHNDETAPEALPLLDAAIRLSPDNAELVERRAFAYSLLGRDAEAEAEWTRHTSLVPKGSARDVAEGWVHLRRGRPADAAIAFEKAFDWRKKKPPWTAVGLGLARLQMGDVRGAIAALETIASGSHDALSMTYLAEAHLAAGDPKAAAQCADVAIDEMDSIHGRSWLVRGDARRAMGDIDGAAKDYSKALWADDQDGVEERALASLEEIDRSIVDEDDIEEDEDD